MGEPMGMDLLSSISFLFATQSRILASQLFCLPPAFMLVSYCAYSSTLKMEPTRSFETLVHFQQTTQRYIPEDRTL
jgi:hypothetical protein